MECTRPFYFSLKSVGAHGVDSSREAAPRPPIALAWSRMHERTSVCTFHNLAKVGVEGSNPFARSSFS